MTTDSYVLGFLHSFDLNHWLLIDKGNTQSKAGDIPLKWCGVGGKIKSALVSHPHGTVSLPSESPHKALEREFLEETGYLIADKRWNCFHIKNYLSAKIYIFQCACSPDEIYKVIQAWQVLKDQEGPAMIHQYPDICFSPEQYTFDLRYLIPMIILESQRGMLLQLDPEGVNSDFKRSIRT